MKVNCDHGTESRNVLLVIALVLLHQYGVVYITNSLDGASHRLRTKARFPTEQKWRNRYNTIHLASICNAVSCGIRERLIAKEEEKSRKQQSDYPLMPPMFGPMPCNRLAS